MQHVKIIEHQQAAIPRQTQTAPRDRPRVASTAPSKKVSELRRIAVVNSVKATVRSEHAATPTLSSPKAGSWEAARLEAISKASGRRAVGPWTGPFGGVGPSPSTRPVVFFVDSRACCHTSLSESLPTSPSDARAAAPMPSSPPAALPPPPALAVRVDAVRRTSGDASPSRIAASAPTSPVSSARSVQPRRSGSTDAADARKALFNALLAGDTGVRDGAVSMLDEGRLRRTKSAMDFGKSRAGLLARGAQRGAAGPIYRLQQPRG